MLAAIRVYCGKQASAQGYRGKLASGPGGGAKTLRLAGTFSQPQQDQFRRLTSYVEVSGSRVREIVSK
jgi:hypothetical protein